MFTAPTRSLAQREAALEKANQVRTARKALKALLKRDRDLDVVRRIITNTHQAARELAVELEDELGYRAPEDFLDSMPVRDLLIACPIIGPVKASRIMRDAWGSLTSTTRRTGGLTAAFRTRLVARLELEARRRETQETITA